MIPEKISAERFLELAESIPVCDVRSPSEYNSGHIPGAINIPLFNDSEREAVGIRYKKEGRLPAILEGLKLSGPDDVGKTVTGYLSLQGWETACALLAGRHEIGSDGLALFSGRYSY